MEAEAEIEAAEEKFLLRLVKDAKVSISCTISFSAEIRKKNSDKLSSLVEKYSSHTYVHTCKCETFCTNSYDLIAPANNNSLTFYTFVWL
jgi:hypothetical protein